MWKWGEYPLIDIDKLTAETILDDEIFRDIFSCDNEIEKARLILDLTARAKQLGIKRKFEDLLKAYKKELGKTATLSPAPVSFDGLTDFSGLDVQMRCGNWICNDNGIRTTNAFGGEVIACYHPLIPVQKLINIETGREKIKLAYKILDDWEEIIVDKEVLASATRIVQLSGYGINVTSENARHLVRYLSDIEYMNLDLIKAKKSSSKLGWVKGSKNRFLPYDKEIAFDGEEKFRETYNSIKEVGSEEIWMNLVKEIRKAGRLEPKISIVASLASVLIEPLNALPFILNIGGETGKGKTVSMMLATSCWANPGENVYMADSKSTVTALELRLDFLNNLPLMLDDMSQVKAKCGGDFTDLIYMLCSGKGKDRANATLGLNRVTTWRNIILTNYEYSLVTETMQGGAINRIIDVEAEEGYIFEDGNKVVEIIKQNYGFAGRRFLEAIEQIGWDQIREWQQTAYNRIKQKAEEQGVKKEEKQMLPMSILLTADRIATQYIFEDGQYLDFETCVKLLKNQGEVSENERAYEFIQNEIAVNISKFRPDDPVTGKYRGEIWGCIEDTGYAVIIKSVFDKMCERGNFSPKSFLNWADKRGLLDHGSGRLLKQKRINGPNSWCVFLKLPDGSLEAVKEDIPEDKFVEVPENLELPFE